MGRLVQTATASLELGAYLDRCDTHSCQWAGWVRNYDRHRSDRRKQRRGSKPGGWLFGSEHRRDRVQDSILRGVMLVPRGVG